MGIKRSNRKLIIASPVSWLLQKTITDMSRVKVLNGFKQVYHDNIMGPGNLIQTKRFHILWDLEKLTFFHETKQTGKRHKDLVTTAQMRIVESESKELTVKRFNPFWLCQITIEVVVNLVDSTQTHALERTTCST